MPGSPRKERGQFPVKATGAQKARRTNRGKARRYTQMVLSARGGGERGSKGEKQVPRRARDDNGEGGAVLADCLLRLRPPDKKIADAILWFGPSGGGAFEIVPRSLRCVGRRS